MTSDDKNTINVYFSTKLEGDFPDMFKAMIEVKLKNWLASEEGQRVLEGAVHKTITDKISNLFSYAMSDDPNYKEFHKIVKDACGVALLRAVKKTKRERR